MKSPVSNVGIMEFDGIRNGSTMNDLRTSTIRNTGKNDFEYSTIRDGGALDTGAPPSSDARTAAARRRRVSTAASKAQMSPVANTSRTMTVGKSNLIPILPVQGARTPLTAPDPDG